MTTHAGGPLPSYRLATLTDVDDVLRLQRDFYAEEGYPFADEHMRPALAALLSDPSLGQVWVAEGGHGLVAYAVLTLGYSLEHHGRDAFVDELFVAATHRGQGLGRAALTVMDGYCRQNGVHVLLLEVEHVNEEAHVLYRRAGFGSGTRHLLKKPIG